MKNTEFFFKDRLTESQIEKFKLFNDEELIFACREHWLPIVLRLVKKSLVGLFIATAFSISIILFIHSTVLAGGAFFLTILITGLLAVRDLIHWSFHIYIATTKQLIEVHYNPLISHAINSVLLEQIRCTEIDVEMYGIIPELLGIGNVEITFDRPTHKEVFVIKDIRSPRTIANLLSAQIHQTLEPRQKQGLQPLWARELKNNKYRFLGDVKYGYTSN